MFRRIAALALLTSTPAWAADYEIDVAHSLLDFTVESALIDATGTFNDWFGSATIENNDLETIKGKAVVKISSIDTRIEKRDNHLKSSDFFDSAQFPEASFQITSAKKTDDTHLDLTGTLSIKNIEHEVTIPMEIKYASEERYRLSGNAELSRSQFGVN